MAYEENIIRSYILPLCGISSSTPANRLLTWLNFRSATRFLLSQRSLRSLILAVLLLATSFAISQVPGPVKLTGSGGTITEITVGGVDYIIHVYSTVGAHTFTPPIGVSEVDYLVVAGGGGGAGSTGTVGRGGGGAGGVLFSTDYTIGAGPVNVVVGGGGDGGASSGQNGQPGSNSSLNGMVALGGGFGANIGNAGGDGGSGGGAGVNNSGNSGGVGQQPTAPHPGFGNIGGNNGTYVVGSGAGGGGGAGAPGGDGGSGSSATGGYGGNGLDFSSYFGTGVGYNGLFAAGGGGSAGGTGGSGGSGGGGNGSNNGNQATSGMNGTGSGGGGSQNGDGGSGGSGIVIIRYKAPTMELTTHPSTCVLSGQPFPQPAVVRILDGEANPINGVLVTAAIETGAGTLSNTIAFTNGSGYATFSNLLITGATGTSNTVNFTIEGSDEKVTTGEIFIMAEVTCPDNMAICCDVGPVNLSALPGLSPTGGVFSGDYVSPSGGNYYFTPACGDPGDFEIIYTYTDANDCINSCSFHITVNALPTASISPDPAEMCLGGSLNMHGNPAGGSGNYITHEWTGTGATYLSSPNIVNPVFSGAPAATYNLTYTVTDDNGCVASDDVTITVNALPVAGITPGPAVMCVDGTINFHGNPSGGSGTYVTHAWTGTGAAYLNATDIVNPVFSGAPAGSYNLTYTVTDDNGCVASDDITITVNALPVADITPDPAIMCADGTINFHGNPSGGSSTYVTHIWTGTGAIYLNATDIVNPVFSGAPAGPYNLTYTVTDDNGCVASDDVTITVNALPVAGITPGPAVMCVDGTINFHGNPSGGSGTYVTHAWTGTGAAYLNATDIVNPVFSGAPAGPYNLTYTVTDDNGCVASDDVIITVNALPIVTCPADIPICEDNGIVILSGGLPAGGTYSGAGVSGGQFDPTIAGPGIHVLTYTYEDPVTLCINFCTFEITVYAIPTVNNITISICEDYDNPGFASGVDLTVYHHAINNVPGMDFFWFEEDGPSIPIDDPTNVTVQNGQKLYVVVQDQHGCKNIAVITFVIYDNIDVNDLFIEFCEEEEGTQQVSNINLEVYNYLAFPGGPEIIYTWFEDGALAVPVPDPTNVTISDGETYYLEIIDDECTNVARVEFAVYSWPVMTCPEDFEVCVDEDVFELTGGSPAGGSYSGNGVSDNQFNPAVAGLGTHEITYTFTDVNGCVNSCTFSITVNPLPVMNCSNVNNDPVCIDVAPFAFTGATPAGGTYSGPGVSVGVFDPFVAGSGTHIITYSYTDDNGCENHCTFQITVYPLPVISCENVNNDAVCIDATPFAFTGATPVGGEYTGPGVSDGIFNPSDAGSGTHEIAYTFTDSNGCINGCTFEIIVYDLPIVTCDDVNNDPVCIDVTPFAFTGATPVGGEYTGPGVSGEIFNPSVAGEGTHLITYTFNDINGCVNSCTFEIIVYDLPIVTCDDVNNDPVCIDATPFEFTGANPTGGDYSGPGVSDGIFNPSVAGAGTHLITYTYTDGNDCSNSCTFNITVYPLPIVTCPSDDLEICHNEPPFELNHATPAGGVYSGPGVYFDAGIYYFNPAIAPDSYEITYSYTDGDGCVNSCIFTIIVHPLPEVTCPANFAICCNDAPVNLNSLAGTSPTGGVFSGTNVNEVGGVYYFIPDCGAPGTYEITYTYTDANGCVNSCVFFITVKPIPAGWAEPQTICSGETTYIELHSSLPNTTFTWTVEIITNPPSGTITGFSPCVSACGEAIEQTLVNTTMSIPNNPASSGPGLIRYTITPVADGCVGEPFTVDVTVNPIPEFFESWEISWNSNFFQPIMEICTGGSILNDNDIDIMNKNTGNAPPNHYFNHPGWTFYYEYSDTPDGPWVPAPGNWNPPSYNPHLVNYQWDVGTDVLTQPGIYYFRFTVVNPYGCPSSSNLIELHVISTLTVNAGGPDFLCISDSPSPMQLDGSYVGGVSTTTKGGTWSITSLVPPNPLQGILFPTGFQTDPSIVTYTPPANYAGVVTLTLTSNDPDGPGGCDPISDNRIITILPEGIFEACFAPIHWPLNNIPPNADGYLDDSGAPCQLTLAGSDNPDLMGHPATTDIISCAGEGMLTFDWHFAAPANIPVWHQEDQQANFGSSGTNLTVNKPTNLAEGDLIIVTIHLRRRQPPVGTENIVNTNGFLPIRKTTTGTSNTGNFATVASFYKIAGNSEPNTYTFTIPNTTSTSNWRILASRVTGHDPINPIGQWSESEILDSPANWRIITVPQVVTTRSNSLLVAALSVVNIIQFPNSPLGMTTIYYHNGATGQLTSARVAIETIETAGPTGPRAFYWPRYGSVNSSALSSVAQMFVINAPDPAEVDAAYYLIDGVPHLLSSTGGESGTISIPITAGTEIGFRVGTSSNTGGRGNLVIYNMSVPEPVPEFSNCPEEPIPLGCNPDNLPGIDDVLELVGEVMDVCYEVEIEVVYDDSNDGCDYSRTFTITATNECGNVTVCQVVYTWIIDSEAPQLVDVPEDADLGCNPANLPACDPGVSATDNCDSGVTVTCEPGEILEDGCLRTQIFTYTATDECGNTSVANVNYVWTEDLEIPVFTYCPEGSPFEVIINHIDETYLHTGTTWDATATDNCGIASLTAMLSGATNSDSHTTLHEVLFNEGTTIVTWTATDECGNTSECEFEVIVLGQADLAVLKIGSPEPVTPGDVLTYTITITNNGPADAPEITLTDDIPDEVLNPEFSTDGGVTWNPWTGSWFTDIPLPVGESIEILIRGEVDCIVGDFENTALVELGILTDPDLDNNTSTWQTTIDYLLPTITPPDPFEFCVRSIFEAEYYDPTEDITPDRPDYYLFEENSTVFDLDTDAFGDNCCDPDDLLIQWRIDFADGPSLPANPDEFINGQPSEYGDAIVLPGDGEDFENVIHTITYRLEDCNGQVTVPVVVPITIKPRPQMVKME